MVRIIGCATAALGLFATACTGVEDPPPPDPTTPTPPPAPTTPAPVTTPTGDTSDSAVATGTTGDTGTGVVLDCAALPTEPIGSTLFPDIHAYHGLAFDDEGNLIGSRNGDIIKYDYYGGSSLLSPNVGGLEQFDMADDGMLYVASGNTIKQVAPTGGFINVATSINAYGVKVGPDGLVYAADSSQIWRIDPVAMTQEIYIPSGPQRSPKVLDWSPDLTKLYFGNLSGGRVHSVDLDSNFDPVSAPVVLATGVGGWHDGLSVDVCGYIYLADYVTSSMFRISPDGTVDTLFDPPLSRYGHGLKFGSGLYGWREDALYIPQPYNGDTVSEVIIETYHRTWPITAINLP